MRPKINKCLIDTSTTPVQIRVEYEGRATDVINCIDYDQAEIIMKVITAVACFEWNQKSELDDLILFQQDAN